MDALVDLLPNGAPSDFGCRSQLNLNHNWIMRYLKLGELAMDLNILQWP